MFIKVREEIRAASSISNYESESTREYINHSCLRSEKCQGGGAFKFVKGSRFTNPFNHINSCIANGNRETLLELYHTERRNRRNGSQFLLSLNATDSERAKHSYLILIKSQSLPLSTVQEPGFRSLSKFVVAFYHQTLRRTILKLVEVVDAKIIHDLKGT